MFLNNEIIGLAKQENCDILGFADLRCLPNEARKNLDYGIIFALSFSKEALQENNNDLPKKYYDEHEPMNKSFKRLKNITSDFLIGKGYEAIINTPASIVNDETLRSLLPQKTVGTLSGIGWIGKNAMLITDEAGSAIRLTVVLTNAPLKCGTPITKSKCDPNCNICTDICPGKAPLGGLWEVGIDRNEFFNAHACRTTARARAKKLIGVETSICGLCISNCPFTKKGLGYY
jgi:epoxyqueuosine reductase QueG